MNRQLFLRLRLPWIMVDETDITPVGDPETITFVPDGTLIGLHIVGLPDGDKTLCIRCDEIGRPESCINADEIGMDITPQSNPRRADESDQA